MEKILIEKVREHEFLYNTVAPNYRDPIIRQEAWDEIGKQLKITGNEAKELWDKLRRCFCNARKRRRDESGGAPKKISPWKYQQQMSFILPFVGNRQKPSKSKKSQSFGYLADPEELSEESEANVNVTYKSEPEEHNISDSESERCDQDDEVAEEKDIFDVVETVDKRYETVNVLHDKNQHEMFGTPAHQNDEQTSQSQASKMPNLLETLDETDLFFLSMSRMAKKLPKLEQSQIKLALSNSVFSAEVRCHNLSDHTEYA